MSQGEVTIDITGDESDLNKALKNSESNVQDFGKVAKRVFLAIGAALAVKKVIDFGKQLFALYSEQEQAEKRLESVLKATGNAAGFTQQEMLDMASAMQDVTTIGDEVIIQSQAIIATFKNIKGDQFKDVLMVAADMAEVLGTDLKGASMQVAKALNDPLKGVSALADAGVSFTEQQKEQIKVMMEAGDIVGAQKVILDELAGEFGGAATNATQTFTGMLKQAWNTIGDVGEMIFAALIPALESLMPLVNDGITFIQNLTSTLMDSSGGWGDAANSVVAFAQTVASWIIDKVIVSLSVLQVAWENAGDIIQLAVNAMSLGVVAAFNEVVHFITVAIPGYLKWFGDNWRDIFTDIYNYTKTIFSNLWKNVTDFWDALMSFLSGDGFDFEFTGLTDGFESAIKELPKIAERELGPVEKELGDRVAKLQDSLGGKLEDRVNKNRKAWADMFKSAAGDAKSFDQIKGSLPTEAFQATPTDKKDKTKPTKASDKLGSDSAAAASEQGFQSSFVGLADLNKRIASSAASSPAEKRQKEMSDSLKDLAKETMKVNARGESMDEANRRHQEELNRTNNDIARGTSESSNKMTQLINESKLQTDVLRVIAKNAGGGGLQ